jgi:AraC-like DNA-binding protein
MPAGLPTHLGVVTYPPGATFGPRNTTDFELVWIIQGNVVYQRDNTEHPCPAESLVMCIPGHTDSFRWDSKRPTRHAFFHLEMPRPLRGLGPVTHWPVVRPCESDDVIRPLFRHLLKWYRPGSALPPHESELLRATVRAMIYAFVLGRSGTVGVVQPELPEGVGRAMDYLHRRLESEPSEPIALADLADASGVSPEHLCRLFRRHTGRTPAATVRLARLDRAATLLARSNYTVGEVAGLTGFASQFHFSRAFKAAFGSSPTELRQRLESGEAPPVPRLLRHR